MVSAKPGLVDLVSGEANVSPYQNIAAGEIIRTGPESHAQLSLGWDASLRLGENSAVVLESVDDDAVSVRIESGSGLVEVSAIDKGRRIIVTSGSLKAVVESEERLSIFRDALTVLPEQPAVGSSPLPDLELDLILEAGSTALIPIRSALRP